MSELADLLASPTRDQIGPALVAWLPHRRWFQGKARTVRAASVIDAALLDDVLLDLFVEVAYDDGGRERYQVPLTTATVPSDEPSDTVRVDGLGLVDALTDEQCCRVLADLVTSDASHGTFSGAELVGLPVTRARPQPDDHPRLLGGEQSNSSVVFGDRHILKLLRRLEPGIHPDIELTRGLTEAGFGHVPAQHGSWELRVPDQQPTALAVLAEFVAGGRDGWELARDEAAVVAAGPSGGDGLLDRMSALGAAVAGMHAALARQFGMRKADTADVAAWADAMRGQIRRVLLLAAERAPDSAADALARAGELEAAADALQRLPHGGPVLRIHGDLHLGQTMLARDGSWQLLDFEGEPARSLAERRQPTSPFRDVAGVVRSFDYAAAAGALATSGSVHPLPQHLASWRDEARRRFLSGYLRSAGPLLDEPQPVEDLLAAFELDKAVYELGYELANRPTWVPIPVGGIVRVLDARDTGRT